MLVSAPALDCKEKQRNSNFIKLGSDIKQVSRRFHNKLKLQTTHQYVIKWLKVE